MADVIGYEEKDERVLKLMQAGYPRFFTHPFVAAAAQAMAREHGLPPEARLFLFPDLSAYRTVERMVQPDRPLALVESDGRALLALSGQDPDGERVRRAMQHTGVGCGSREAEDFLFRRGLLDQLHPEEAVPDPQSGARSIRQVLHEVYGTASPEDILLCRGGMHAFYVGYSALRDLQLARGRPIWVQLGWLYVDTMRLLEGFGGPGVVHRSFPEVCCLDALESFLRESGSRVAAIVTETPTNPLVQTPDLDRLRSLADRHGVALVLDPTLASPHNLNVLPYCDLHINSLTKYAGSQADVMLGALALRRDSPFCDPLRERLAAYWSPPGERDLGRLAVTIRDYASTVDQINRNTLEVARFLDRHPRVEEVHWAYSPPSRAHYASLAGSSERPGGIISFRLGGRMADFYDAVPMPKGPSFGACFSLLCPFLYLAHYDLVSSPAGREELRRWGIEADLVRLSVGTEPVSAILEALEVGLSA